MCLEVSELPIHKILEDCFIYEQNEEKKRKTLRDLGENLYEAHRANFWVENLLEAAKE